MQNAIILVCLIIVVIVVFVIIFLNRKSNKLENNQISKIKNSTVKNELLIQEFPLSDFEECSNDLVEIKDKQLVSRINSLVSETAKTSINAGSAISASSGTLYKAVIPSGAKLVNSQRMEGAVRGMYRGTKGIKGHANFVEVSQKASAVANATSAAMNVGSMIVGQYYMSQINDQLDEIGSDLKKISSFQDTEYRSKVFALVTQVKSISEFKVEIIENDELRISKINQLNSLEQTCIELLGQASLNVGGYSKKTNLDFDDYEEEIKNAQSWYEYEQGLLNVLYEISELKYALYLGNVSRDECSSLLPTYSKQVSDSVKKLSQWHKDNIKRLEISVKKNNRKRQGIEGVVFKIPAIFNKNLNYKSISKSTTKMIKNQQKTDTEIKLLIPEGLYDQNVNVIIKDNKAYYNPCENNH